MNQSINQSIGSSSNGSIAIACVCMYVCVCVCVQEGSNMCDWLKVCKFCIYHAVYRLDTKYMKSFIPYAFLCTKKYRIMVRIKKLNTDL